MSTFPFIQPEAEETSEMELYKEVKWNFENDRPVFRLKEPVIVTGNEAVKTWAWNALNTARKRWDIFTWNYGSDFDELIGQAYSSDVKTSECKRYLKECLLINPYISSVENIEVNFDNNGLLMISCTVKTIYGEASINV
ncbi:MAG: DUF2634 domain-containing protein [Clostridia bacterium]|jgi:hypothetical protein|nr:DUF2634 domain-containing protein [Clostridia bacterium]